ncbi:NPCBM/NEW2 domain-containing protein [Roseiconus lacunae]|uniref:NPCBM/NEW2 domain-containing protein n=1 Tax=Roseiconus lacunae TaxID=2605694 RepID=A0ABT7PI09_9BACT|nr:NPCBM/NEW2 domain-containing protein [Roseiconus lacunae]MDM4016131.1 NPCBM/NEW2 domain-containing protein [Roseiconus lacunae]
MRRFNRWPLRTLALLLSFLAYSDGGIAAEVEVELSSGEKLRGNWVQADTSSLTLQGPDQTLDISQIVNLRPTSTDTSAISPPVNAVLVDGSQVRANSVQADDQTITIKPRTQAEIKMPLASLRAVRFRPSNANTDPQWLGLFDKEIRSDLMVIHRSNAQLDPVEGIILSIDEQTVSFELDGDTIEAPVERLEGVVFRNSPASSSSKTVVEDVYGSSFNASRIELIEDAAGLRITLANGVTHELKISQLKRIRFASGQQLLAGLAPADKQMRPYLKTAISTSLFDDWFAPAAENEDIVASAGGGIEYRVEDGFEFFSGSVGRDPSAQGKWTVKVQIAIDEEVKWEQELSDWEPAGFRLSVAGARRIKLKVIPTGDGDVGDLVRFYKPRLLK